MTPTNEDFIRMRDVLNAQQVPPPHYVIFPDETIHDLERIIQYPQGKTEDCKMTERTRKEINKDIQAVNKKIQERSMIVGPVWARSIISFEVDDGVDDVDDVMSFDEWDEEFTKFQNGETSGEVVVHIQSVGCDGGARLTQDIMYKIEREKFQIMIGEMQELRELRKERHRAEQVAEAERNLESLKAPKQSIDSCLTVALRG